MSTQTQTQTRNTDTDTSANNANDNDTSERAVNTNGGISNGLHLDNPTELTATKYRVLKKTEPGTVPDEPGINTPCIEWDAYTRNGYGRVWAEDKIHTAHRLMHQFFNTTEIEPGHVVHHECANTTCVNPDHLATATARENSQHAYETGRLQPPNREASARGGRNSVPGRTIPKHEADDIRDTYTDNPDITYADLAREHDCSKQTIGRIIKRERRIDNPNDNDNGQ